MKKHSLLYVYIVWITLWFYLIRIIALSLSKHNIINLLYIFDIFRYTVQYMSKYIWLSYINDCVALYGHLYMHTLYIK